MCFDASGVVFVPADERGAPPTPRLYAVLRDGAAFLVNAPPAGGDGGMGPLEPVPRSAQDAIRTEHAGRKLHFPPLRRGEAPGAPPLPAPSVPLLWVDPLRINLIYGAQDLAEAIHFREEVRAGDWDRPAPIRFAQTKLFTALEGHLLLGEPWESTAFFKRVVKAIKRGETKFGCSTEEEFQERRRLIDELYTVIRADGYRTQSELGTRHPHDEIRVAIRRDGRFMFLDGRHRLSIARILGLPEIPVRVTVRHAEWEAFKSEIWEYARKRDGRIYQVIDHPDLREIPAHHGSERVDLLTDALSGYDCRKKRLLDIGTHWGFMAMQMEKLGFLPTGVESNARNARFAKRLAVASESGLVVWRGDIFDFPEAEQQQLVLALNIFHHLIKTQERHDRLIRFLRRLTRAEVLFFEPHRSDSAQLKGAFRNYAEEEFAEFVAEHAGMRDIQHLGTASDGRHLFMLSR